MRRTRKERMQAQSEALEIRARSWPFVSVPSALLIDLDLSDGAKLTYAFLHLWGQRDGKAWPNRSDLADARGVARATLHNHLGELEDADWIERFPEGRRTVIRVKWWHEREGVKDSVNRSSQLDQSSQLDPGVQPVGLVGRDPPVCDEREKREEREEEARAGAHSPFDEIERLRAFVLTDWERDLLDSVEEDLRGGRTPTDPQQRSMRKIARQAPKRHRDVKPANASNVPTQEQQNGRVLSEIEADEKTLKERDDLADKVRRRIAQGCARKRRRLGLDVPDWLEQLVAGEDGDAEGSDAA